MIVCNSLIRWFDTWTEVKISKGNLCNFKNTKNEKVSVAAEYYQKRRSKYSHFFSKLTALPPRFSVPACCVLCSFLKAGYYVNANALAYKLKFTGVEVLSSVTFYYFFSHGRSSTSLYGRRTTIHKSNTYVWWFLKIRRVLIRVDNREYS